MVGFDIYGKRHNKPCTNGIAINDLVKGVGGDDYKIGLFYADLLVFFNLHNNTALQRILDLIKRVLGVLCKKAFCFTSDDPCPINTAFHKVIFNNDVIFSYGVRFSCDCLFTRIAFRIHSKPTLLCGVVVYFYYTLNFLKINRTCPKQNEKCPIYRVKR